MKQGKPKAAPRFSTRVQAARRRVQKFLDAVSRQSPSLIGEFPRRLEAMAPLCHDSIHVRFIEQSELTEESISRTLMDRFRIKCEDIDGTDTSERYGFLYCHDNRVFVFSDPSFGDASALFTKAHEIGHLYLQYLQQFESVAQTSLLEEEPKRSFMAFRETYVELHPSLGNISKPSWADEYERRAERNYLLNEAIMNGFAAELIAPFKVVYETISDIRDEEEQVDEVRKKFGLSREAAKIRVKESTPLASASESFEYTSMADEAGDDEWTLPD